LAAQLRLKASKREKIADLLDAYGEGLAALKAVPVVGSWAGLAGSGGKLVGRLIKRKAKDGLTAQRSQLREALARLDSPIVVIIDDIDRLQPQEILDILRLVRLTGNFPNLIYLLAFDRGRVELILNQQGFEGGPYLEKIVEYAYDVPAIPPARLQRLLLQGIDDRSAGFAGVSGADRWPDIFYRVVGPLFGSLRDVKRYLAVLPTVLSTVGDEVAVVDVLALEAVRVALPGTYASLIGLGRRLAGASHSHGQDDSKDLVEQMINSTPAHGDALRDLCRLLFPGTEWLFGGPAYGNEYLSLWRRERRVANPDVFAFYLTRTLEPGAASAALVDSAFDALSDEGLLRSLLDGLDTDTLEDLLPRLEAYEEEFPAQAVEPAVSVLLDLYGRLPARPGALVGPHIIVNRVILRLLRRVSDQGTLTDIVLRLYENAPTLQAKFRLVRLVGHAPNAGHRLIPETDAEQLENSLHRTLLHAPAEQLQAEHEVLLMLTSAVHDNTDSRADLDRELQNSRLVRALITDALGTVITQQIGSFNVQHQDILNWEALIRVFGDQTALANAIARLSIASDTGDADSAFAKALALAHRYLAGWRPDASWLPPALNTVAAQNGPRNLLRPLNGTTAGLVIRVVARHRLDAVRANQVSLASSNVHSRMQAALAGAPILDALRTLAASRGVPAVEPEWRPGPDQDQNAKLAVEIVQLAANEPIADLRARCAIVMPGMTDSELRIVVEVQVAGRAGAEDPSGPPPTQVLPLILTEVRDLMSVALRTAELVDRGFLRDLIGIPKPPRIGIETHLAVWEATQADGNAPRQNTTLTDVIDLTPLGHLTDSTQRQEGAFASNDAWDLREPAEVDRLTVEAMTSMARDWGFLNIDEVLPKALQAKQSKE